MEVTVIALAFLLLSSNIFWAYNSHRLMEKIMSRDYRDLVQVQRLKKEVKKPHSTSKSEPELGIDPFAAKQAEEANNLMGFI